MNKNISKGNLFLIPNTLAEDTADKVISPQVKEIIPGIKYFLVENIRTARRFISSMKLGITIEELSFELLDKNTRDTSLSSMMAPLEKGQNMGVISESGCPGIADPGALAVSYAHRNNIKVLPLAGPSSLVLALMASGFNGQSFKFHGYLPIKKDARIKAIRELEKDSAKEDQTQLFIETPYRNDHLLNDIINNCNPGTQLSIAIGLTGADELVKTRRISEWKKTGFTIGKIPAVFLIYVSS